MARLIKISYSGLTIGLGGDASITLNDRYSCSYGYTEFAITFEVTVRSGTRATFLAAEAALIAAFRKPDGDLDVELGGTNRHAFTHSGNTGFNARATCEKIPDNRATANSAAYRCSVTVQLPADLTGRGGRQTSAVSVDATPAGKRTVVIEGTYTALSGDSAKTVYEGAADTYCDGVISAIGGTFELLTPGGGFRYDDQNKVLSFQRRYQEVIYNEASGTLNLASIVGQELLIRKEIGSANDLPDANSSPLFMASVQFSCFVRKSETTDLKALYESTIRPHILEQVRAVAGSSVVVMNEAPAFSGSQNSIQVAMQVACDVGAAFYEARLDVEEDESLGNAYVPVWDGNPFARDEYEVPAEHSKVVTRQLSYRDGATPPALPQSLAIQSGPNFKLFRRAKRTGRYRLGIPNEPQIPVVTLTQVFYFTRADLDAANGGIGGGLRSQVRGEESGL